MSPTIGTRCCCPSVMACMYGHLHVKRLPSSPSLCVLLCISVSPLYVCKSLPFTCRSCAQVDRPDCKSGFAVANLVSRRRLSHPKQAQRPPGRRPGSSSCCAGGCGKHCRHSFDRRNADARRRVRRRKAVPQAQT